MRVVTYVCDAPGCNNTVSSSRPAGLTAAFGYGDRIDLDDATLLHFCTNMCLADWAVDRFKSSAEARSL